MACHEADAEEHAAGFYERGEAVFRLLADCFDGYAEGYNYLGLIALQRDKLEEAIGHFQKTIELGRKLFPKRIGKKRYARMLVRVKMSAPKTHDETRDRDRGVDLIRELRGFLSNQRRESRRFFEAA